MTLYGLLGQLESRAVLDTITKEVVGINAPKIAVTRSNTERLDVATSEIGNTVAAFGLGGLLNYGLGRLFKKAQAEGASQLSKNWAVLARSGAIYSTIFALMWAMPFIRNYLTAKRTGSTEFTEVIGAKKTAQNQANLHKALSDYKRKIAAILGLGLAGAAMFTGLGKLAVARKWGMGVLKTLFDKPRLAANLLLKNGSFNSFSGTQAVLFWGVPAYGGWIQASRDPYEKKEQVLKFLNFVTCFSLPQVLANSYFGKKLEGLLPAGVEHTYKDITTRLSGETKDRALKLWGRKNLTGLLASIVLLGVMPPLMNIFLTKRRLDRAGNLQAAAPPALSAGPSGGLAHKSFAQWGVR